MSEEHDYAWKYLPEHRRRLHGAARIVGLDRQGTFVWVPLRDVTPAELSLLVGFARAAESRRKRNLPHLRKQR